MGSHTQCLSLEGLLAGAYFLIAEDDFPQRMIQRWETYATELKVVYGVREQKLPNQSS